MFWGRRKKRKEIERKARDYDQLEHIIADYKELHKRVVTFVNVFNKSGKQVKPQQRIDAKRRLDSILDKLKDRL